MHSVRVFCVNRHPLVLRALSCTTIGLAWPSNSTFWCLTALSCHCMIRLPRISRATCSYLTIVMKHALRLWEGMYGIIFNSRSLRHGRKSIKIQAKRLNAKAKRVRLEARVQEENKLHARAEGEARMWKERATTCKRYFEVVVAAHEYSVVTRYSFHRFSAPFTTVQSGSM